MEGGVSPVKGQLDQIRDLIFPEEFVSRNQCLSSAIFGRLFSSYRTLVQRWTSDALVPIAWLRQGYIVPYDVYNFKGSFFQPLLSSTVMNTVGEVHSGHLGKCNHNYTKWSTWRNLCDILSPIIHTKKIFLNKLSLFFTLMKVKNAQ